jgi:hypothetical protein
MEMPPVVTNGLECKLTISSGPKVTRELEIIFGDIWLCLGQSNMLMSMKEIKNSKQEMDEGEKLNIYFLH